MGHELFLAALVERPGVAEIRHTNLSTPEGLMTRLHSLMSRRATVVQWYAVRKVVMDENVVAQCRAIEILGVKLPAAGKAVRQVLSPARQTRDERVETRIDVQPTRGNRHAAPEGNLHRGYSNWRPDTTIDRVSGTL